MLCIQQLKKTEQRTEYLVSHLHAIAARYTGQEIKTHHVNASWQSDKTLPTVADYIKHFGSFKNAKIAADIAPRKKWFALTRSSVEAASPIHFH